MRYLLHLISPIVVCYSVWYQTYTCCLQDLELPVSVHSVLSPYQSSIKDLASRDMTVVDSIRLVQLLHRDLYALNIKSDLQNAVPFTMKETSLSRRKVRLKAEQTSTTTISLPQAQRKVSTEQGNVFEQLDFLTDNPMGEGTLLSERDIEVIPLKA